MTLPIENLTPQQIVQELDRYIVGQYAAKRAVAIALRNRFRRQQLSPEERQEVMPKNILMMGPTGVGKTEIARRLAQLARAPFIKVEATKFTEVGYVGRDVESMIRDLTAEAVRLVEKERADLVRADADAQTQERLVELLLDQEASTQDHYPLELPWGSSDADTAAYLKAEAERQEWREKRKLEIAEELAEGRHEESLVEIETEESSSPFLQVFTPGGIEEMGLDALQQSGAFGSRRVQRRTTVRDAREVIHQEEALRLLDRTSIHREAVRRAEQTGIIFLDEIDKVAGKSGGSGPDVSREGVQRDLLPIIEGSTVSTKFGPVKTDHILFIAAGAFHISSPDDLIPELQGRLPIRVELEALTTDDLARILSEPKSSLLMQYKKLLAVDGVEIEITPEALQELALLASNANKNLQNIGARRLHTMMEKLLEEYLFSAPESGQQKVVVDRDLVRARLGPP